MTREQLNELTQELYPLFQKMAIDGRYPETFETETGEIKNTREALANYCELYAEYYACEFHTKLIALMELEIEPIKSIEQFHKLLIEHEHDNKTKGKTT